MWSFHADKYQNTFSCTVEAVKVTIVFQKNKTIVYYVIVDSRYFPQAQKLLKVQYLNYVYPRH